MEGIKIEHGKGAALLNKLQTNEEFARECAYWALREGFDELRPHFYPTKPDKVIEYESWPLFRRARLKESFYNDYPEINSYYQQRFLIYWKNKATLEWLKEILRYIPPTDTLAVRRLDDRILEIQAWFNDESPEVNKVIEIFDGREVGDM